MEDNRLAGSFTEDVSGMESCMEPEFAEDTDEEIFFDESLNAEPESDSEPKSESESEPVCPRCKKTVRSEEQKRKLMNRLNRIEGQIRGLRGMVERDAYCNDILIQSAAATAAINSFNKELLSAHIHSCVVRDIRDGKDEVVDELVATIYKLMR